MLNFSDSINISDLENMIKEITTGDLGEIVRKESRELYSTIDIDELYMFHNGIITLYYEIKGFPSKYSNTTQRLYTVYYNNVKVYSNNGTFRKGKWISELKNVYKNHLRVQENNKKTIIEQQDAYNRAEKVRLIFSLVGSKGYQDDKIIIDQVEYHTVSAPDWSNSKDKLVSNGRIRLIDGTVLMDTRQGIYHPGNWEYYVCDLVDTIKSRTEYEQMVKKAIYDSQREQKKLELKRKYQSNHSPIDDSKYF